MQIEIQTVTPAMAKKWLEKNHPNNRPIVWGQVESLANDMARDAFTLTHQGVCFDGDGNLIDGQHRLSAVVKSGKSVKMVVCHNDKGAFESAIDRGRPRSLVMITGRSRRQIAILTLLRQLEQGFQSTTPMTLQDLTEYSEHHIEALNHLENISGYTRLMAGAAAAAVWAMPINQPRVTEWTQQVISGEMLKTGDPALAFRRSLERRNGKLLRAWPMTMAALNSIRHHVTDTRLRSCFTGEEGYRAITSQRRKFKVPHTPSVDLVPSRALKPHSGDSDE